MKPILLRNIFLFHGDFNLYSLPFSTFTYLIAIHKGNSTPNVNEVFSYKYRRELMNRLGCINYMSVFLFMLANVEFSFSISECNVLARHSDLLFTRLKFSELVKSEASFSSRLHGRTRNLYASMIVL